MLVGRGWTYLFSMTYGMQHQHRHSSSPANTSPDVLFRIKHWHIIGNGSHLFCSAGTPPCPSLIVFLSPSVFMLYTCTILGFRYVYFILHVLIMKLKCSKMAFLVWKGASELVCYCFFFPLWIFWIPMRPIHSTRNQCFQYPCHHLHKWTLFSLQEASL